MSQVMVLCEPTAKVRCDNCDWDGVGDDLDLISDFEERVSADCLVPAGQCPECGALAYLDSKVVAMTPPNHEIVVELRHLAHLCETLNARQHAGLQITPVMWSALHDATNRAKATLPENGA